MATLRNSTGWASWRTKARAWFMEQGLDEVITKERPADRLLRPTTSAERVADPRAGRRQELLAAEAAIARKERRPATHLRAAAAASGTTAPPGSRFIVAAWETFGAAAKPTATLVADLLRAACGRIGLDGSAAASLRRDRNCVA